MTDYKYSLIQWYKRAANKSTPQQGDTKGAAGIYLMKIPDKIVAEFNIPTVTSVSKLPITEVAGYKAAKTADYLEPNTDAEATPIDVEKFFKLQAAILKRFKTARVRTSITYDRYVKGQKSGTGFRTAGLKFPKFFDLLMIAQALGTLIKAKNPGEFGIDGGRNGYPLLTMPSQFLTDVNGNVINKGAWVITSESQAVATNNDETGLPEVTTNDAPRGAKAK